MTSCYDDIVNFKEGIIRTTLVGALANMLSGS
jgi:hypothetical protein